MSMLATEKLNSKEADEYAKCKYLIQEHRKTWRSFAEAMKKIRDQRLYRQEFKTFDAFCEAQGLYEKHWVDKIIAAYEVSKNLETRVSKNLGESLVSVKHWLALRDVPSDRIDVVLKRIDKDRAGKPVTTAIIKKAIEGPAVKPVPPAPPKESQSPEPAEQPKTKPATVDGYVASTTTVTTPTIERNDEPKVEEVAVASKPAPAPKTEIAVVSKPAADPVITVEVLVRGLLKKADGIDVLEELLKQLVEDGNEYSVAEICRKYAGASEPTVVQVDDPEEIARVEKAMQDHQAMIVPSPSVSTAGLTGDTVGAFATSLINAIPQDVQEDFVTAVKNAWKVIGKKKFVPPTLDEVKEFFEQEGTHIDPVVFFDHYQKTGWKKSDKQPVKSLRDCLKTFERNQPVPHPTLDQVRKYCEEEKSNVNPDYFFHFYKSQGWRSRKTGWVRDWRSTLKTHENDPEFCRRIPTLEEVRRYVAEIGGKLPADKFFNCFQARGWIEAGGAPVVDWKAKYNDFERNPAWLQSAGKSEPSKSPKWKSVEVPEEYLKSNPNLKPQGGA